ncbi:MAG: chorismate-binding protein [Bacteroidales bacterium]
MNEKRIAIHNLCIEKNLSFATYRLPRQDSSTIYIQTSPQTIQWNSIHDISEKRGFIMAPFDTKNGKKYIMVKPDIVIDGDNYTAETVKILQSVPDNGSPDWNIEKPVVTSRKDYLEQVKTIKENISNGAFQKTVLSRIKTVEGNFEGVITKIFDEVCKRHPNAFVYMFKSDNNFWLGASPEPLLRLSQNNLSTVSLAGTRTARKQNMDISNWSMKEVLEQEYVTRYIHDILREFKIRDYRVTSPYVKQAGDLVHLRTDFSLNYKHVSGQIWELLDALHPTPAVAGQPKEDAISFIKQLEPHDREYYAGFLGPVQSDDNLDLFVNLRCMKITPGYLALYIGGGITLESVPEEEWEETQLKAKSLLSIIDSFSKLTDDKKTLQATHK